MCRLWLILICFVVFSVVSCEPKAREKKQPTAREKSRKSAGKAAPKHVSKKPQPPAGKAVTKRTVEKATQQPKKSEPKKAEPTWDLEWKEAPEISPTDWINSDKPLKLSDFRGKKFVLLEFWWIECPHCIAEVPRMKMLHMHFGDTIQVITVVKGERKKVEEFVKANEIKFPVGIDGKMQTFRDYAMKFVPFAYVINKKGTVVWQGSPHYLDVERMENILELSQ